jgi:hypothetical protein
MAEMLEDEISGSNGDLNSAAQCANSNWAGVQHSAKSDIAEATILCPLAFGADLTKSCLWVDVQIIHDEACLFGAHGAAVLCRGAANLVLDCVEHGDPAQYLGRDQ